MPENCPATGACHHPHPSLLWIARLSLPLADSDLWDKLTDMTLNSELAKLLNAQINHEMSASYSYLAMAAWFEQTPYAGFASWMFVQSAEETVHALKFYQFLVSRDAPVALESLAMPKADFKSPLDVFAQSLEQEQTVTMQINELYDVAERVRDHASKNLLLWFLNEQIEEEKSVRVILDRLTLAGDDPASLLELDREAAARNASRGAKG